MSVRASMLFACLPWLPAVAQVQSAAPTNARATAAVPLGPPAPVATAPLRGLKEHDLGQGKEVLIPGGSVSAVLRREVREGRAVLVETTYETSGNMLNKKVQATSVRIHPAPTRIVAAGAAGMWLLRPAGTRARSAPPPPGQVALDGLSRLVPGRDPTPPAESAPGSGCGLVVPAAANDAAIGPLTCLLLEPGQGAKLPGAVQVFRRSASLEVWQGDVLVETVTPAHVRRPLLLRDPSGRHWLLDPLP